jgi:hypothetical protein
MRVGDVRCVALFVEANSLAFTFDVDIITMRLSTSYYLPLHE